MNNPKKKVLNGKFHNIRPVGNREEGWMLSTGTHHRSLEYEDGGDEQNTETNGGAF